MKETDLLSDQARPALPSLGASGHHRKSAWPGDNRDADAPTTDDRNADHLASGLANVGFIGAALRRTKAIWCSLAVVGLAVGVVLSIALPASREAKATTAILIGNTPGDPPGIDVQNDQGLIQSRAVAGAALRKIGLRQNPATFVTKYTTSATTNQIMSVTVTAPSPTLAVREANALGSEFVAFQAGLVRSQQGLLSDSLESEVSRAEQALTAVNARIRLLSGELPSPPSQPSPAQDAEMAKLQTQSSYESGVLSSLQGTLTQNQIAASTLIRNTKVLDPAVAVPAESAKRRLVLYGGGGLLGGLVAGIAVAIIGALISGRLRRRDDVARALGAPVRLSVSRKALSSVRPRKLLGQKNPAVQQVVAHLRSMLSPGGERPSTLAVVPVDHPGIPALCLATLAVAESRQGRQVVVADLCDNAPAGTLLGAKGTGVQTVTVEGARLTVVVPEGDPVTIDGPLSLDASKTATAEARRLAGACASADLLLTLVPLDPSVVSDHLDGWADRAVPFVTVGRSSATHIYAVGEMIRIAGLRAVSAVLLGSDKTDESLGVVAVPEADRASAHEVHTETVLARPASPATPVPWPGQAEQPG